MTNSLYIQDIVFGLFSASIYSTLSCVSAKFIVSTFVFILFSLWLSGMGKKVNFKEQSLSYSFSWGGGVKFHVYKLIIIQPTHIKRIDEWKSIFIELIHYYTVFLYHCILSNGYGGIALQTCTKAVLWSTTPYITCQTRYRAAWRCEFTPR